MKIFYPETNDNKIALSEEGHYALYVVEREEKELPNSTVRRYEIVNLSTLAVEARVANLTMAFEIMSEFDRRLEAALNGDDIDSHEDGMPYEVSSPSQIN